MKYLALLSIWILLYPVQINGQVHRKLILNEKFQKYSNGSDGSPLWNPVRGNWQIIDGKYTQQSDAYDCAAMFDRYIESSFEMTAEFEQLDGDAGAGFVFSSERRENTSFAQLVRFDGSGILIFGYYQNGEYNGTSSVASPSFQLNTRHTLTLIVDRDSNSCRIMLDGKILCSGERLRYPAGYVGLQSSGGRLRYHSVRISINSSSRSNSGFDWIRHFALSTDNRLFIPSRRESVINVFDMKGTLLRTIGSSPNHGGFLSQPAALAFLDDTTLVIADGGTDRIHLASTAGRWIASAGWKGSNSGEFDEPVAVAVTSSRQIVVLEKKNHRVQVLDERLRPLGEFGNDKLLNPLDIAIAGNLIWIVNTGFSQVECYRWDGKKASWQRSISYGGGEARGIAVHGTAICLSIVNEVRLYDTSGTVHGSMRARSTGFMLPQSLGIDHNGNLCIADYFYGRILRTTLDLIDPEPEIATPDSATAIISWQSVSSNLSSVQFDGGNNGRKSVVEGPAGTPTGHHSLVFQADQPGSKYSFAITPSPIDVIPADKAYRNPPRYTLTLPHGKHRKTIARLPMAALVFTNVIDTSLNRPGIPAPPQLAPGEVERIRKQLADGVRFYWIHSGMKLFLDLQVFVVNEPYMRSRIYGSQWWYPPNDTVLQECLGRYGHSAADFPGILYLTCTRQYDTTLNKYVLAGKGGAFTNGVGTGKGYGISWWDVTKENHNAGNNWLMVHEFNHQLDDIFMVSGYPEYWFNHISPTIGTAGPFSEHFDANAYIMQIVPSWEWTDLRYTILQTTKDGDDDGIPDNDPVLPLDEMRLGSDTTSADSDSDGVRDAAELPFSNWITEGWGETYGGKPVFPDLRSRDTDHDGIPDAEDPYPCSAVKTTIRNVRSPQEPGVLLSDDYRIGELHDPKINAVISGAWKDDSLRIALRIDRLLPVKIMLDADADGWFLGRGNYTILLSPSGDSLITVKVQDFNATDPDRWPFTDQSPIVSVRASAVLKRSGNDFTVSLVIGRNDFSGLTYKEGKRFGMSFGFLASMDTDGDKRYIDLLEPNRLITLTLKR